MAGRKRVSATATVATVKVELGVVVFLEDGQDGVVAIESKGRMGHECHGILVLI